MKVNGAEKLHRYLGVVAAEYDPLDEELEQLLAFVRAGYGEQRVEVLEYMAKPSGIERLAGRTVYVGLYPGEVVLEQPQIAFTAAVGVVELTRRVVDAWGQRSLPG